MKTSFIILWFHFKSSVVLIFKQLFISPLIPYLLYTYSTCTCMHRATMNTDNSMPQFECKQGCSVNTLPLSFLCWWAPWCHQSPHRNPCSSTTRGASASRHCWRRLLPLSRGRWCRCFLRCSCGVLCWCYRKRWLGLDLGHTLAPMRSWALGYCG